MSNQEDQSYDELSIAYKADEDRYRAHSYGGAYQDYTEPQLIGHMMLVAHSLEKGLSSDVFELGHGFSKLVELADMVDMYAKRQYDTKNAAYINALSTLESHVVLYRGTEYEGTIYDMFANIHANLRALTPNNKKIAGIKKVSRRSKQRNDTKNFEELVQGRSSARAFSEDPINKDDLKDAIRLAQRSPSACNRQAIKVYEMHDPEIIKEVMFIQEGFSYQSPPPCLTLIVADDHNFSGAGERNQGYIDGGLFAMTFMYALEYKKLAACPLHASFTHDKEQLFRKLLNIPDNEKLIVFIAIGQFKDEYAVAKSYRYPVEYVSKEVTHINRDALETGEHVPGEPRKAYWLGESVARLRRRIRIRTRVRNVRAARKEGKLFFSLYSKLHFAARTKRDRIFVFGAPFHGNLGDQAQTYCTELWYKDRFPNSLVIAIDTASALKKGSYIVDRIRQIVRSNDKIVLHSGYHTTDLYEVENDLNLSIIERFPELPITVLPQTIHFENNATLKATANVYNQHGNITLMCRDEQSYKVAGRYFKNAHLKLMPDIVTMLIGSNDRAVPRNKHRDNAIMVCFRNDKESKYGHELSRITKKLKTITQDVTITDTTLDIDPYYLAKNRKKVLRQFLSNVARHKLVITDRYHGTIFSAITNTPVIVLGSTDHKLSSGVKWFDKVGLSGIVHYAESPKEAIQMAHDIYGSYDFSRKVPAVFKEKYWNKKYNKGV